MADTESDPCILRADSLDDSDIAITVFAPTDAAFDEFLATQNWTLFDLLDSDYLTPIMEYHLVPAVIPVAAMTNGEEVPTFFLAQNLTLASPLTSNSLFTVNAAESTADIIEADIAAGQVRFRGNAVCMLVCTKAAAEVQWK